MDDDLEWQDEAKTRLRALRPPDPKMMIGVGVAGLLPVAGAVLAFGGLIKEAWVLPVGLALIAAGVLIGVALFRWEVLWLDLREGRVWLDRKGWVGLSHRREEIAIASIVSAGVLRRERTEGDDEGPRDELQLRLSDGRTLGVPLPLKAGDAAAAMLVGRLRALGAAV